MEELAKIVFPVDLGEFSAKSFETVFNTNPKIIEYVRHWSSATGIFEKFLKYVKLALNEKNKLEQHEKRCIAYIKPLIDKKIPTYMRIYKL